MGQNDWYPLYFDRLRKSKWWRRATDLARARNIMLWGEAYKAVPAGSLDDDDDELAEAAGFGMDVDAFLAAKAEIMAPWTLCSDGRWYHPTLCEVVLDTWDKASVKRKADAERKQRQRARLRGQDVSELDVRRDAGEVTPDSDDVPRDTPPGHSGISTEEKRGQDRTPPNPPSGGGGTEMFDAAWLAYPIGGRANHGPDRAQKEWGPAAERAGGEARLLAAIVAHAAQIAADRSRPKAFDRWLRDDGFVAYLDQAPKPAAAPTWDGPLEIWDAIAAAARLAGKGEGWMASYPGRCTWQGAPVLALVAPHSVVAEGLREIAAEVLSARGITITTKSGRAA